MSLPEIDFDEWERRNRIIQSLGIFQENLHNEAKMDDEAYMGHLIILFRYLMVRLSQSKPGENGAVETAVLDFMSRCRMKTPDLDQSDWEPESDLFTEKGDEKPRMLAIMPPMSFEGIQKPIPEREESPKKIPGTGLFEGILDGAGSKESPSDGPPSFAAAASPAKPDPAPKPSDGPPSFAAVAASPATPNPDPVPEPVVGPVEKKITGVLAADNGKNLYITTGDDKIYLPWGFETDITEQSVVTFIGVLDDEGHFSEGKIERTVLTGKVSKFTFQGCKHFKVTVEDQDYRVDTTKFGRVLEEKYGKGEEPVVVRFYAHRFLNREGLIKTEDRGRKLLPNVSEILMD